MIHSSLRLTLPKQFRVRVSHSCLPHGQQILNFGLPAPIDVQVVETTWREQRFADALLSKLSALQRRICDPAALRSTLSAPRVERTKAEHWFHAHDIAQNSGH